jgi:Homing endonuclease associated repeat
MTKREIIAAIRRASRELGRAPSRGELKSRTGVSHYQVLTQFRSLREAVRAAGLTPSAKGERVSTEALLRDWKRVRKKLGRRPSRAEYVREGKYSAGAFVGRFGSWGNVKSSTTEDTKEHRGKPKISRESTRKTRMRPKSEDIRRGDMVGLVSSRALQPAAVPSELNGHRRVTELVAAMVVGTLLGPESEHRFIGTSGNLSSGNSSGLAGRNRFGELRRIYKDRPLMGPPFGRHRLTNAPVNEMGVSFIWALVAWELGFQVEAMQGRYPDCLAKREVLPGKWQPVNVELEYESKNFLLHGHDPKRCDVIVCWRHNWKECPEEIEVIELSRVLGM